jgi:thiamine phosphate synthase YjbQ (UPF0047 family)
MKSFTKELWFETRGRQEFIDITEQAEACLRESGIQEGLCLVNAMHITASVFINDNEGGLHADFAASAGIATTRRERTTPTRI